MKKKSLNTVKSILNRVNRYRCCPMGASAVAFSRDENKEKILNAENRKIR